MKKKEILNLLKNNGVKVTNLNSFISKARKSVRQELEGKKDKILKWMEVAEKKATLSAQKAAEKTKAKKFCMSRAEMLRLEEKAKDILSGLHTGHSMGCYRRLFINGELFAENDCLDTYSNSCTWVETYGSIEIHLNKAQLRRIVIEDEKFASGYNARTIIMDGKILKETGIRQHYRVEWE